MADKKTARYHCVDFRAAGKTLAAVTQIVNELGPDCRIEITSSDYLRLKEKYDLLENAAKNLAEDCGCISPWRIDVLKLTQPEQSEGKEG